MLLLPCSDSRIVILFLSLGSNLSIFTYTYRLPNIYDIVYFLSSFLILLWVVLPLVGTFYKMIYCFIKHKAYTGIHKLSRFTTFLFWCGTSVSVLSIYYTLFYESAAYQEVYQSYKVIYLTLPLIVTCILNMLTLFSRFLNVYPKAIHDVYRS